MAEMNDTSEPRFGQCTHDGCESPARSRKSGLCEMHYYRMRRRGSFALQREDNPPPEATTNAEGYVREFLPHHPLWGETQGRLYQHRRVFFDAHGKGPHRCNWCGCELSWDTMDVDHVNAIRDDNRLSNLVPSCRPCNVKRGLSAMTEAHRLRSRCKISFAGETLTEGQWAERIGISRQSLRARLAAGWSVARALTQGRGVTGPR